MFRNILIYNPFGIGDVLFSTPLIKALADNFPQAKVYYIANQRGYFVLKNNPYLEEIVIFEKDHFRNIAGRSKTRFLKRFFAFLKKVRSFRADLLIDVSLNYQASLIGKILGIPKRIGFNYKKRGKFLTSKIDLKGFDEKHAILYYMDILKPLGIDMPKDVSISSFTSPEDDRWAENLIEKNGLKGAFTVAIVPGGGRSWGRDARYRRWHLRRFASVADRLIDELGLSIIILGDKKEAELCGRMRSLMRNKALNMGGRTSVAEFMALLKRCGLVLCNEGGPMHVAVSLGVPTVSIFGPVDEKIYGPFGTGGSKHVVVSDRTRCKPCYANFKHRECETLDCLESISEDKVFNSIRKLWREKKIESAIS